MSTETQKIDVLAVMERAARELWVHGEPVNPVAADMLRARAAVAELIESAHKASQHDYTFMPDTQWVDIQRLKKALARVGGAA